MPAVEGGANFSATDATSLELGADAYWQPDSRP